MADIELVIKISENDFKSVGNKIFTVGEMFETTQGRVYRAIVKGTPLPKGHGDLVDISPYKGKVICSHLYSGVKKLIEVDSIEPIIEADKDKED